MPRIVKKAAETAAPATPAAPAAAATTTAPAGKKRNGGRGAGIDRSQFKWCIWAGNSRKPIAFVTSKEEVKKTIAGLKGSQLKSVTVGELHAVTTKVTADCAVL